MADKRKVQRNLKQLQHIKTWQLVVLLILFIFVAATFLRLNSVGMSQRRTAVLQADQDGSKQAIQERLFELQSYVSSHMNADMGTVYLENQYKRDSQAAIDAASDGSNPNGNVFKKAQEVCAPRYSNLGGYSLAYQQCVIDQLNQYPSATELASSIQMPRADAYRHSYISPLWTPDFAGFSVLICLLIFLVIIVRLVSIAALRMILKSHSRGL